jgi:hypothetical protein
VKVTTGYALVLATLLAAISPVRAGYPISKIADTNTPIPGGTGDFTSFDLPVADHAYGANQIAAFIGNGSGGSSGIYTGTAAGLSTQAATGEAAPGGGNFTGFSSLTVGLAQVTFIADTSDGDQGVYESNYYPPSVPMGMQLVARTGSSPATGTTFGTFYSVAGGTADGTNPLGNPIFSSGVINSSAGVYYFGGTQTSNFTFTQEASPANYSSLGSPSYVASAGGNIPYNDQVQAINASVNGVDGIYYSMVWGAVNSTFSKIADTNTTSLRTFVSFGQPAAGPNAISFPATYQSGASTAQGIFVYADFQAAYPEYLPVALSQLVGSGDLAPGSGGAHFSTFQVAANKMFLATLDNGVEGIYAWNDAVDYQTNGLTFQVEPVIDTTDLLDGKTIASFGLSPEGGNLVGNGVFEVNFTDGSSGIYSFDVPEPACVAMIALPAFLLRRCRHHLSK